MNTGAWLIYCVIMQHNVANLHDYGMVTEFMNEHNVSRPH